MITDRQVDHGLGPVGVQLPNHRPRVNLCALGELDRQSAHFDQVSLATEQTSDAPLCGEGTSTTALSVSTETIGWSTTT